MQLFPVLIAMTVTTLHMTHLAKTDRPSFSDLTVLVYVLPGWKASLGVGGSSCRFVGFKDGAGLGGAVGLRVTGLCVVGLCVVGLGVVGNGTEGLGVISLGVVNLSVPGLDVVAFCVVDL